MGELYRERARMLRRRDMLSPRERGEIGVFKLGIERSEGWGRAITRRA